MQQPPSADTLPTSQDIQRLIDAMPFYVLLVDETHCIRMVNRTCREALGLDESAMVGTHCPKTIHGVDGQFPGCPLEESVKTGGSVSRDLLDPASGMWIQSSVYPLPFKTNEGKRVYLHFARDVTDDKKAEEISRRLHDSRTVIDSLLVLALGDAPLDEILAHALDRILSVEWLSLEGRGAILLVDGSPRKLAMRVQRGLSDFVRSSCARVDLGRCLCGRAALSGETVFADRIDGRHDVTYKGMLPHGHYCVPIKSGGNVLGVITIYIREGHPFDKGEADLLEAVANTLAGIMRRKRIEEQFIQAQKMDAVGRLAGGVAHDFNNILSVILSNAGFILDALPPGSSLRPDAEEIRASATRAAALTRQILAFSRKQVVNPDALDVNAVIRNLSKMLMRLIGEHIQMDLRLADGACEVWMDPSQLEQILVNLVVNARDAMPSGGRLTIETTRFMASPETTAAPRDLPPGDYVVIGVADTGVGMDKELQKRIFEPFFTTKPVGKGTGLGLSMVYGAVKQNGGSVTVQSEPGAGTTFRVHLKRLAGRAASSVRPAVAAAPRGNGELVLLVEDEEKGLAAFDRHKDEVNLVLSDIVMPGMNGIEMAARMREREPAVRVLHMSGYSDDVLADQGMSSERAYVLSKPIEREALLVKIGELLGKPSDGAGPAGRTGQKG